MNTNAEATMNQFRAVATTAMIEFFTSDMRNVAMTHRRVKDIATDKHVHNYDGEDLSSMNGEVTMTDAYDADGNLHVIFESEQDGLKYTFGYAAENTTMMNVMMKVVLSK